jgi:hydrogenase maturation protease
MNAAPGPGRRIMVAGIGNPDRGDDAVGARVAADLAGRLPADVAVISRSGDLLSLIEDWAGLDALICIDAAAPSDSPGLIRRIDLAVDELPPDVAFSSSHAFGLPEAIALARTLDLAPAEIVVYAVEGACFDAGAAMTPEVEAAIAQTVGQVLAEVARLRQAVEVAAYA